MTRDPFPFRSHLTLAEADEIERLRERFEDHQIAQSGTNYAQRGGLSLQRMREYLARNPRKRSEAA